ncbi:MAG: hypothetical protein Q9221_009101 [Calogaya cf. arnoldii]
MAQAEVRLCFFSLARELRDRIYEYALTTSNVVSPSYRKMPSQLFYPEQYAVALLRTNKQISNEAAAILYSSNTFELCSAWSLEDGIYRYSVKTRLAWLHTIGQHNVQRLRTLRLVIDPPFETDNPGKKYCKTLWLKLLHHLATKATGLRNVYLKLDALQKIPKDESTRYYFRGLGHDQEFVVAMGTIQGLRSMVIDGFYGETWPGDLTERMAVTVKEDDRPSELWKALRSYQKRLKD